MKTRSKIRIPMPARYVINLALVVGFYFLLTGLISSGIITNYWTGILITVGINIILAVSLNIATGYLGQLPLGHAGFMAVGAYAGGIFMKATPAAALLKEGNTAALIPYILAAIVISAVVAGIFVFPDPHSAMMSAVRLRSSCRLTASATASWAS